MRALEGRREGKTLLLLLLGGGKGKRAVSLASGPARPEVDAGLHYAYTKSRRQGASHASWPMTTSLALVNLWR